MWGKNTSRVQPDTLPWLNKFLATPGPKGYVRQSLSCLLSYTQMVPEEPHLFYRGAYAVRSLAPAVAFVGEKNVFHGNAAGFQRFHDLLRFNHWDVGVIGAVLHHGRGFDAVQFVNRRQTVQ